MTHITLLSDDPKEAVEWLMDVDVIRMPIEIAQVLSTVSKRHLSVEHCSPEVWTDWVATNKANYEELWNYAMDILDEHFYRFGSRNNQQYRHGISGLIDKLAAVPSHLPEGDITERPLSTEQARLAYTATKASFTTYTHRSKPEWKTS